MFYPNEFEQGYFPRNGVGWYKVFSHPIRVTKSEELFYSRPTWIAYYSEDDKLQCVEYHPFSWTTDGYLTSGSTYEHRVSIPVEDPAKCGRVEECRTPESTLDLAIRSTIYDISDMVESTMFAAFESGYIVKMRYVRPEALPERIRRFNVAGAK